MPVFSRSNCLALKLLLIVSCQPFFAFTASPEGKLDPQRTLQ
jgi:hypothetical protein